MKRPLFMLFALLLMPIGSARAQLVVTDPSVLLQEILSVANQLEQLNQQRESYQTQIEELQTAINQLEAITGVTGVGGLLNGAEQIDDRRYVPSTWEETLAILEAGGNPGSLEDVRRVYEQRQQAYKIATRDEVGLLGPDDPTAIAHERNRRSTLASGAVAEAAFSRTPTRVEAYEAFMTQIERSPTSKTTLDLANRIAAENGLTTNEVVRLLASQMAAESSARAEDLVARSKMERVMAPTAENTTPAIEARLRQTIVTPTAQFAQNGGQ